MAMLLLYHCPCCSLTALTTHSVVQRLMGLGLTSESIRVVHRLDKMTHGLLCVGLSRSTGAALAKSLVAKSWRKLYRVLCTVPPPALRATFVPEAPIGGDLLFERGTGALRPRGILESYLRTRTEQSRVRHPFLWNNMLVESVPKPSRPVYPGDEVERPRTPREERKRRVRAMFGPGVALGRISRTEFTLQGTGFDAAGRDVALYIARLLTGRTHQLRVHFSDAGAPMCAHAHARARGPARARALSSPHTMCLCRLLTPCAAPRAQCGRLLL
jgi:23S rRNA-/tRNA-specific pseudouridylate synthase